MMRQPRWPWWILGLALIAIVGSLIAVSRLRADTSLEALFAQNDPAARAMVHVLNHYSAVEELLVLATTPANHAEPEKLASFAADLEKAISSDAQASKLTAGVIWRTDPQTEKFFEQVLVPSAMFYLDDASFAAAKQRLTTSEISQQISQDRALLATPGPAAQALSEIIRLDPLRLHDFIMDRLASLRPFKTYQNSNAFLSPDGRSILIRIRGTRPVSDLQFSQEFTSAIERLANQTNRNHLDLDFTGSYAIAAASQKAIRSDLISSITGSVIFLQVLFLVAYRRPIRSFLLAIFPIAVGILLGFAAYSFLKPTLTPLSAAIGGVLAGMGIDYSIQFLAHYQQRRLSMNSAIAATTTLRILWPAMLAAWATSVIGFAAIGSANVQALRDFSLLGSLGLTGAFLAAITILPAMLASLSKRDPVSSIAGMQRFPVDPKILRRITEHRVSLPAIGIALFICACAIFLFHHPWITLDTDLTAMHPHPNAPLEAEAKIASRMGASPEAMICYLRADSPEKLVELAHVAGKRLRQASGVSATFGLDSLLPDPEMARKRLTQVEPGMAERVVSDFNSALASNGFSPAAFTGYAQFLQHLLNNRTIPDLQTLIKYRALAETILPTDDFSQIKMPAEAVTYVFTKATGNSSATNSIGSVRGALSDVPGATLTGLDVLGHDAQENVGRQLPKLIGVAMGLIAIYLLIHFRNFTDAALSLLPTIFSIACVLAYARLSGTGLNIINLVAFPLLIGIDVDYGVFLVSSARKKQRRTIAPEDRLAKISPSFSAVILCAAATILGFASLMFTSIPSVSSLGLLVSIGILACVIAISLVVVPAMMS